MDILCIILSIIALIGMFGPFILLWNASESYWASRRTAIEMEFKFSNERERERIKVLYDEPFLYKEQIFIGNPDYIIELFDDESKWIQAITPFCRVVLSVEQYRNLTPVEMIKDSRFTDIIIAMLAQVQGREFKFLRLYSPSEVKKRRILSANWLSNKLSSTN